MAFQIFKENSLNSDRQTVSSLSAATVLYRQYFADGYAVRVVDLETAIEYAMRNEKLVAVPYSAARRRYKVMGA